MDGGRDATKLSLSEKDISLIKGNAYDMASHGEDLIYRYLMDWYVTIGDSKIRQSLEYLDKNLLEKQAFSNKNSYVMHGRLVAQKKGHEDIQVRLDKFDHWSVDRASAIRGVWVESPNAWYWLQKPSEEHPQLKVTLTIDGEKLCIPKTLHATLPAQAELHVELRAKFGLISNLCDAFLFDEQSGESLQYLKRHSKKNPEALHKDLKPTPELLARFPSRPEEAFDLKLLKRYPSFVKQHLKDFCAEFKATCNFMKNLKNPTRQTFSQEDFERSALAAEARGARHPWGELRTDVERLNPNWVFLAALDESAEVQRQRSEIWEAKHWPHEDQKEVGPQEELKTKILVGPQEELKTKILTETTYQPRRMEEALNAMKSFLVPEPLGSETMADVRSAAYKFRSPKSALEFVEQKMRQSKVKTWEYKLLVASTFTRMCTTEDDKILMQYGLTFCNKKGGDCGLKILFETWRSEAIDLITRFDKASERKVAREENTEQHALCRTLVTDFLIEIANFCLEFRIVKTAKTLEKFKTSHAIDFEKGLAETSEIANKLRRGPLVHDCNRARSRLRQIKEVKKEEKSTEEEKKSTDSPKKLPAAGANVARSSSEPGKSNEKEKKDAASAARRLVLTSLLSRTMATKTSDQLAQDETAISSSVKTGGSDSKKGWGANTSWGSQGNVDLESKPAAVSNAASVTSIAAWATAANKERKTLWGGALEESKVRPSHSSASVVSPLYNTSVEQEDGEVKVPPSVVDPLLGNKPDAQEGGHKRRTETASSRDSHAQDQGNKRPRTDSDRTGHVRGKRIETTQPARIDRSSVGTLGGRYTPRSNNLPVETLRPAGSAPGQPSQPHQQASRDYAQQPQQASHVVGRGRGLARTTPAWMTGGNNVGSQGRPAAPSQPPPGQPPRHASRDYSRPPQQNRPVGGLGRGKHVNRPAWMTGGDNVRSQDSSQPLQRQAPARVGPSLSVNSQQAGAAMGRGRGRNMTMPAWMTKQQQNQQNP